MATARTVELVGEARAVRQHRALRPLARQDQVEQRHEAKPAQHGGQRRPGEEGLAGGEAGQGELGHEVRAAMGVAGVDQAVADGREAQQDAQRPHPGAHELKVRALLLAVRRHGCGRCCARC